MLSNRKSRVYDTLDGASTIAPPQKNKSDLFETATPTIEPAADPHVSEILQLQQRLGNAYTTSKIQRAPATTDADKPAADPLKATNQISTNKLKGKALTTVNIYNNYGGLIEKRAADLGIDVDVIVGIISVESGGQPFNAKTGKMTIRFENHVFRSRFIGELEKAIKKKEGDLAKKKAKSEKLKKALETAQKALEEQRKQQEKQKAELEKAVTDLADLQAANAKAATIKTKKTQVDQKKKALAKLDKQIETKTTKLGKDQTDLDTLNTLITNVGKDIEAEKVVLTDRTKTFDEHFKFSQTKNKAFTGHEYRHKATDEWTKQHSKADDQETEYDAFELARTIDETAAMESISMGAGQVMGFNHKMLGYDTVQEMYDALSGGDAATPEAREQSGTEAQINSIPDFIKANNLITAVKNRDYVKFATTYNGSGQAADYGKAIEEAVTAFEGAKKPATPAAPATSAAPTGLTPTTPATAPK